MSSQSWSLLAKRRVPQRLQKQLRELSPGELIAVLLFLQAQLQSLLPLERRRLGGIRLGVAKRTLRTRRRKTQKSGSKRKSAARPRRPGKSLAKAKSRSGKRRPPKNWKANLRKAIRANRRMSPQAKRKALAKLR